jgi:hypothetical protein
VAGFMRGCAPGVPDFVASGPTGPSASKFPWDRDGNYGDWYGGHELAHAYGRGHANFCGATGGPAYPYPQGMISLERSGARAFFGFDIGNQTIYGPESYDLMTYCPNIWISDFTYEGLMGYFQGNPIVASGRQVAAGDDLLLVAGSIAPETGAADLLPVYRIPDAQDAAARLPGDYAIVLRSVKGVEIARYPFTPLVMRENAAAWLAAAPGRAGYGLLILEMVPYVAGTARVEVEGPGGQLLGRLDPGPFGPSVALVAPNGGEAFDTGPLTVTWTASDPDEDPLAFALEYSADNGATWEAVAQALTGNTFTLDASNLPASAQALFRVWASDGVNTASDRSDAPFTVFNHAPEAAIISPEENTTSFAGQTLNLQADAYDPDTGAMDGDQLRWSSSLDGLLGIGAQLSTNALSAGEHIITLTADDGAGGMAADTVAVSIVPDPSQLPAVSDAIVTDPPTVVLNPAAGVPAARIRITNRAVVRPLAWQAQADAEWVGLSAISGTTPGDLIVTLVGRLPSGVGQATITVTSPDAPGQVATVRVLALRAPGPTYLPFILH